MWQRKHVYTILIGLGVGNSVAKPVLVALRDNDPIEAFLGGFGISVIVWLALGIGFWRVMRSRDSSTAMAGVDWLVAASAMLAVAVPLANAAWFGTAVLSAWWLGRDGNRCQDLSAGALILFVAALREPIALVALGLLAGPMLTVDAEIAGALLSLPFPQTETAGNVVLGPEGHRLLIMTGCSSYTNLSIAVLGWLALVRGFGDDRRKSTLLLHAAGLAVTVFSLNVARLAAMGVSPEWYAVLHDGWGAGVFAQAPMVLTVAFAWWSLNRVRPQAS
jgi:exosortase/archaeosortase family protein